MFDKSTLTQLERQLISWRRQLHRIPEASYKEEKTSQMIAAELQKLGLSVQTFSNHLGVCAVIHGSQPGPVIAFRADMDALSIREEAASEFRSEHEGAMHACGHDGHMAILLGLASLLHSNRQHLAGTIKLFFQSAEEASPEGGAQFFLEAGLLDDVSAIFGLHLWPDLPCGEIGLRPGALMAASDRLSITILGEGAHAGQPQHGVDAITIAADVLQGISHILCRQLDPLETATINIGQIHGGDRYNVIAREVVLEGTVRTLSEGVRGTLPSKLDRILSGMTASQGGSYRLNYQHGYPVLNNWPQPTALLTQAAITVLGADQVHTDVKPVLAAEDFSKYLVRVPGSFFWLGCGFKDKENHGLHSPYFEIDEAALLHGVAILYQTALLALKQPETAAKQPVFS